MSRPFAAGMVSCLLAAAPIAPVQAQPPDYGTFEEPFTRDAIWNERISRSARRVSSGISTSNLAKVSLRQCQVILQSTGSDRPAPIWKKKERRGSACGTPDAVAMRDGRPVQIGTLRIPEALDWRGTCYDGGRTAIAMTGDGDGASVGNPNLAGEVWQLTAKNKRVRKYVVKRGEIAEFYAFEKCETSSGPRYYASGAGTPHPLDADGLTPRGTDGGSALSSFAGVIRDGELTSATPIRHALKITLPDAVLHYDASDESPDPTAGFTWPACRADGYAASRYLGRYRNLEMGRLLSLSRDFNCSNLATRPARKICRALKDYGGFVSDASGRSPVLMFEAESQSPADQVVRDQVRRLAGFDIAKVKLNQPYADDPKRERYRKDMRRIVNGLKIVLNGPDCPKGDASGRCDVRARDRVEDSYCRTR